MELSFLIEFESVAKQRLKIMIKFCHTCCFAQDQNHSYNLSIDIKADIMLEKDVVFLLLFPPTQKKYTQKKQVHIYLTHAFKGKCSNYSLFSKV